MMAHKTLNGYPYINTIVQCQFYRTLKDIVEKLQCEIDINSEFDMVVRRSHVLRDALQRMQKVSFDPRKKLNVMHI